MWLLREQLGSLLPAVLPLSSLLPPSGPAGRPPLHLGLLSLQNQKANKVLLINHPVGGILLQRHTKDTDSWRHARVDVWGQSWTRGLHVRWTRSVPQLLFFSKHLGNMDCSSSFTFSQRDHPFLKPGGKRRTLIGGSRSHAYLREQGTGTDLRTA